MTVKFKRLPHGEGVELPNYQTPGAAGMDVRAADDRLLPPGTTGLIPTGFAMEIPEGFEAQMRPRSGLAAKFGLTVLNSPGTIDHDFRGEVQVILTNLGAAPFQVQRGERIAQMVFARVERAEVEVVSELSHTERGEGGFGHTGTG